MLDTLKVMRKNQNLTEAKLVAVVDKINEMNNVMSAANYGLSEAYHIGPAYFKELVLVSDNEVDATLEAIFESRIDSILREYTRGRRSDVEKELIEPCKNALLGKNNG